MRADGRAGAALPKGAYGTVDSGHLAHTWEHRGRTKRRAPVNPGPAISRSMRSGSPSDSLLELTDRRVNSQRAVGIPLSPHSSAWLSGAAVPPAYRAKRVSLAKAYALFGAERASFRANRCSSRRSQGIELALTLLADHRRCLASGCSGPSVPKMELWSGLHPENVIWWG